MDVRHFTQRQLAQRWAMSPRTLEKWRWLESGPSFLKVGGHIVYRLEDIEEYERTHRHLVGGSPARDRSTANV